MEVNLLTSVISKYLNFLFPPWKIKVVVGFVSTYWFAWTIETSLTNPKEGSIYDTLISSFVSGPNTLSVICFFYPIVAGMGGSFGTSKFLVNFDVSKEDAPTPPNNESVVDFK